jgi:predicted Na+-dependent transporter
VGSNLIGIATVPFYLKAVLSSASNISLDAVKLLIQLLLCILAPLIIGKVLQDTLKDVRDFVRKHKVGFMLLNNGSLILIVWQSISRAEVRQYNSLNSNARICLDASVVSELAGRANTSEVPIVFVV